MGRKSKILVWLAVIVGVVAVLGLLCHRYADRALTGIAEHYLKKELAKTDSLKLGYSNLSFRLATGKLKVKNVVFSYLPMNIEGSCKSVELGPLKPLRVWKEEKVDLDYIRINSPRIAFILQTKKSEPDTGRKDAVPVTDGGGIVKIIKNIGVRRVSVDNGSVSMKRTGSKMSLSAEDLDLSLFEIGYNLEDRKLRYCDSLYSLSASGFSYISKDSLYRLDVDSLKTENAGGLFLKGVHGRNTTGKKHYAVAKGKVPVTWSDLRARALHTSSINLVRTVLQKSISIDSLSIEADKLNTYRDSRFSPKKAFPMPQESIQKIPLPLHIGTVDMRVTYFDMEVKRPEGSAGLLTLHDMGLKISNLSNQAENTAIFHLTPRLGKGRGEITIHLKNDRHSSFSIKASAHNINLSDLGSLTGPLFGVSAKGEIQSIRTAFKGNSASAGGDFCMLYDNLDLKIDSKKTPIEFLEKHGKLIDFLEGGLIHRQNPRKHKNEPFTCKVGAKRDPMKNFGSYMVSTVLDGVEQTVMDKLAYKLSQKKKAKGKKERHERKAQKSGKNH
ncbi:MAG: hypothetical protein IK041_07090 [Bacteroidales bacterium]|nr:hypothetical protein [Bacteroidales bacterium]